MGRKSINSACFLEAALAVSSFSMQLPDLLRLPCWANRLSTSFPTSFLKKSLIRHAWWEDKTLLLTFKRVFCISVKWVWGQRGIHLRKCFNFNEQRNLNSSALGPNAFGKKSQSAVKKNKKTGYKSNTSCVW